VSTLIRHPNLHDPDGFYAALIAAHEGLSEGATGDLLNARLALILANHVGDPDVLREALALASEGLGPERRETIGRNVAQGRT
jgi:hypothetical protein